MPSAKTTSVASVDESNMMRAKREKRERKLKLRNNGQKTKKKEALKTKRR